MHLLSFNTEISGVVFISHHHRMCHRTAELEGTVWGLWPNPLFKAGSTLKSEQLAQGYPVTSWKPPRTAIPQPLWTPVPVLLYIHSNIFFSLCPEGISPSSVCCLFSHQASGWRAWLCFLGYLLAGIEKLPLKFPPPLLLLFRGRCTSVSLLCGTFYSSFFHANLHEFHTLFPPVMLQDAVISITFEFIKSNYVLLEPTIL